MWSAKRSNVSGLCIWSSRTFQAYSAHLASVIVERFNFPRLRRVSYDPRYPDFPTLRGRIASGFLCNHLTRYDSFWNLNEPEAPNLEAGSPDIMPVIFDSVETIVALASAR